MDQVETEVLFKQDNPDFSALSHTPNKEETLSNGTGLTATIGNGHYGGPQLQRSTKEPEAQTLKPMRVLHVIRRMSTWTPKLSKVSDNGLCPAASPVAGPLS